HRTPSAGWRNVVMLSVVSRYRDAARDRSPPTLNPPPRNTRSVVGARLAQSTHGVGSDAALQSSAHSQSLPARSACPHAPSPRGDSLPTAFKAPTHDAGPDKPPTLVCMQSNVVDAAGSDHGYARCNVPAAAAYIDSASVGRKPPSQAQNAIASNQVMQLIGSSSLPATASVHVANDPPQMLPPSANLNAALSATGSA